MDTSNLKKFAVEARDILVQGVQDRLKALGFGPDGSVDERFRPTAIEGGALFLNQDVDAGFLRKWEALEHAVKHHEKGARAGVRLVAEEAAYTWFNRFVAIRILQKNNLIEPQLAYVSGGTVPQIVENARHGRKPAMSAADLEMLNELLEDDSKVFEQFAILIVAYCHNTPILEKCFGHIDDYTELLLPRNVLAEGGFVWLLNSTPYITEEDFKQTELIGWLYQFYISKKKDEVYASFKDKKKAEADDIPAATQIFTPNWIVKYMVQNTLGRIYLDNGGNARLSEDWKYLVEKSGEGAVYHYDSLESLKVADFACGSGHILNEFFDMLLAMYRDDDYGMDEAIENIFAKNMLGIDLDTRARQLTMFSLLLKACQKSRRFLQADVLPRIYDMPEPITDKDWLRDTLPHFFRGGSDKVIKEATAALKLMESAKNLGSIMVFNVSGETRKAIEDHIGNFVNSEFEDMQNLVKSFQVLLALTDKYSAIVMNPPYMEGGKMNVELAQYVKSMYPNSKADLFSVFMEVAEERLKDCAKYGMINMQSWMFLTSFENLRTAMLGGVNTSGKKCEGTCSIDSMLHLGPRTFDELAGEVVQSTAYVITKEKPKNASGTYFRLVDGENSSDKERLFFEASSGINPVKILYAAVAQRQFEKIPGGPVGYWVGERVCNYFSSDLFESKFRARHGLLTGRDEEMVRVWTEVSFDKISFDSSSSRDFHDKGLNYAPLLKGGSFRKWYGNLDVVTKYDSETLEYMRKYPNFVLKSEEFYFKEGLTWTLELHNGDMSIRYMPKGLIFSNRGASVFADDSTSTLQVLGFLSSKVASYFFAILSPSLSLSAGTFNRLPIVQTDKWNVNLVKDCISISKSDWDAHETSWDFQGNELLAMSVEDDDANVQYEIDEAAKRGEYLCIDRAAPEPNSLAWRMNVYQGKWERLFFQLHANEEELNRQFIDIYGLGDELTPDVLLDDVTILQQGEISIGKRATCNMSCNSPLVDFSKLEWHEDVVMKQFVSYAVGCIMGRYRLDKPGLAIAHSGATDEEIAPYTYNGETFAIDDDGILPLMPKDECAFTDNAEKRFTDFLRTALGVDSLGDNLNYVDNCLGSKLDEYLSKDKGFWADHKKMYQNRPIYWLFSSKKGAFRVAVYMHRMTAFTAQKVRNQYLLPHISYLESRVESLKRNEAELSAADRKVLKKLQDALVECREYDERLHEVANKEISIDLDDGVVKNYALFGDVLAKVK